ncbi:sigma-54-dependent Fis family transcriptional regulator, partial [Dissulfurirhabdus thermomarina]|nr:sigma-54-dependent Fis family transcriptional regulator [Dissulfurirhabdus thermomarina]
DYDWPGNVRELRNVVERMVILSRGPVLTLEGLPPAIRRHTPAAPGVAAATPAETPWADVDDFKAAKACFERAFLQRKLDENGRNISRTAKA